jgi:flavin reductase (DIM6/NTAB) family NADH-FMN oxidoreductase RutF
MHSTSPDEYRRTMRAFPTGVVVVTAISDGVPVGLSVGSFTSVSLDPPLVGFFPAVTSTSWPRVRDNGRFCVNVLAADQLGVCRAFANSGGDKYAALSWRPAPSGSPLIEGVLAWLDCSLERVHAAGDHWFALGRVHHMAVEREEVGPLLFFRGGYGDFVPTA